MFRSEDGKSWYVEGKSASAANFRMSHGETTSHVHSSPSIFESAVGAPRCGVQIKRARRILSNQSGGFSLEFTNLDSSKKRTIKPPMEWQTKVIAVSPFDFTNLPILSTDQDLEKLGVLLGDRRKMLRAIADLDHISSSATPPAAQPPAHSSDIDKPFASTAQAIGERRHATVIFCDLVDSTGLATRLDVEEWRELVATYVEAASLAIVEMGGKVLKKLGDGLMAVFGYPVAQENDAERAVRAALSIQRALIEVNRMNENVGMPALAARIAIDAGPVVIDGADDIYGAVPNIAARAQALAEPGEVIVTGRVQHQVSGLFVVEGRGSHTLKGVPEPVALYQITRASGISRPWSVATRRLHC
jgi:class 3 adenylate cyclase